MSTPVRVSKRDPEGNRAALINATLDSIVEIGIVETTVSKITERAGLSRGMIHLHFGGKAQLLIAATESFNADYYEEIDRSLLQAGQDAEAILMAVVSADLGETLLTERSTKLLHAFRGAADPKITLLSNTRDKRLRTIIRNAFEEIAQGYDTADTHVLARDATFGLLAMLEGMWVDYLSNPSVFSREVAKHIVYRFLNGLFPAHFIASD